MRPTLPRDALSQTGNSNLIGMAAPISSARSEKRESCDLPSAGLGGRPSTGSCAAERSVLLLSFVRVIATPWLWARLDYDFRRRNNKNEGKSPAENTASEPKENVRWILLSLLSLFYAVS